MNARQLIKHLDLKEHPEGGFYKEVFRSKGVIDELPDSFDGARNYSTSIYFLLTSERPSAFHRIRQDEIWYFHIGSPIDIHILNENGLQTIRLGQDLELNQQFQSVVPAGQWFAAEVVNPESFGLVSCMVAPGFDFKDFELANRAELTKIFPMHEDLIKRFTRK